MLHVIQRWYDEISRLWKLTSSVSCQVDFKQRHGHLSVSADKDNIFYVRALGGWVNAQVTPRTLTYNPEHCLWVRARKTFIIPGYYGRSAYWNLCVADKHRTRRGVRESVASFRGT